MLILCPFDFVLMSFFCIWRYDSPTYGLFHVFALYHFIGFVSLYFIVGRILPFRHTFFTVLSTFVLPSLKALVLFQGLVFSLKVGRYILCDPTDNFATSGTSRIYYSANAE